MAVVEASALDLGFSTATNLTDNCRGLVQSSSKLDQISNHRVLGSNPSFRLSSIGEELLWLCAPVTFVQCTYKTPNCKFRRKSTTVQIILKKERKKREKTDNGFFKYFFFSLLHACHVDLVAISRGTNAAEAQFGNFTTNSYVYVGGLPSWFTTKLSSLALPSVVFEPRFRGAIRNLIYADDETGRLRRQEVMAYKVSSVFQQR